jgi:tetratricopeptide (TPR) repeat protein
VARTLYDDQGAAQRARLHRRIAETLERTETIPAAQRTFALARHWGAASPADPQRAGHYAEQAGRLAIDQSEPQAAQRWLARALELHDDTAQSPQRRLDLLIALGVAQRQDGQPAFRETLLEAARLARAAGDTERLAEAALANNRGFVSSSGVLDDERVAVLEAALEAVGTQDDHQRARLLALLAAELAFTGRRRERTRLSDEALALARRLGDPAALSFVLNIRFVPIWAPDTLAERLANTAESMRLADRLGDAFAQFQAVHWRALGLVQAGRLDEATAAVARETKLAATLGDPTFVWMAAYDRANLAMIAGRLEEAEALAGEALAVATASGQPDGFTFWGSQVFGIRHEQGRLSEFLAVAAQMVGEHPGLPSLRAGLALAYVQTNLPDDARELLVAEAATGFEELPEDVIWLSSHVMYAHVCADVGEREIARTLSERLAAWPDVVAYTGLNAWGTAGHAIGRLAVLLERHDEAEEHLTTALAAYRRMGAPVWHARAALDSARLFMTRGAPGDRDRARTLLEHAAAEAARLGSARVAQRAECLLAGMQAGAMLRGAGGRARGLALPAGTGAERSPAPPPPVADATPPAAARAALVQEGELWRVTFDGRISYVRGSRGIRHLVRLLEAPGQELHALELQVEPGAPSPAPAPEDGLSARGGGEGLPVLDAQAKAAYRERLAELEAELEEAERFHDPERVERARTEREAIARELAAAMGLGGRDRQAVSAAERARSNVSRAIRSAVRRLGEADPALAEHLRRCVRTGTFCVYDPPPGEHPAWELGAAG